MVLEFTKLEYHIIFFNCTNPTQQCHSDRTDEELEFLKLEFLKKWYFAIYFRNSVLLLKISKKGGICPFWRGRHGILNCQDLHTNQPVKVTLDILDSINLCFLMVTIGIGTNNKDHNS